MTKNLTMATLVTVKHTAVLPRKHALVAVNVSILSSTRIPAGGALLWAVETLDKSHGEQDGDQQEELHCGLE